VRRDPEDGARHAGGVDPDRGAQHGAGDGRVGPGGGDPLRPEAGRGNAGPGAVRQQGGRGVSRRRKEGMSAVLEQRETHASRLTGSEPGSPVLELRDLHVSYGRTAALHGVNLRVMPAEVVALIGANGAGKSTTLRAISGLLKPTRGEIVFQGRSIGGLAADRVVAQGIAQSPEERHVWPAMT